MSTQFDIFLANYNTTYYICQYILRSTTIAQATLSMRVDETLKKSFDSICDDFGFTSTAAITVFMKTVVRAKPLAKLTPTSSDPINPGPRVNATAESCSLVIPAFLIAWSTTGTTYPDGHTEVLFTPLAPFETPEALDRICEEYNRVIGNYEVEPLLAIPIFIHDFLCIHPFNDGNGRMSRLLTTLLLYRSGFYVGKYISLEAKIAKNKDLYYEALGHSQDGWHEGEEDAVPFIKYLLGTILAAYKDFEDRFEIVEEKLPAIEMVRKATQNKIGKFNKQDIRELCPSLSVSSIEGSLRKLVAEGELRREGTGKSTFYVRLK